MACGSEFPRLGIVGQNRVFIQGDRISVERECEAPAEPRFSIEHKLGRSLALPLLVSERPFAIALRVYFETDERHHRIHIWR